MQAKKRYFLVGFMVYYLKEGDNVLYDKIKSGEMLVILSLDGGMLDLNRLRYNYFKNILKEKGIIADINAFVDNLGDYHKMYDGYGEDSTELNNNIEKDLFAYARLKPDIKKTGVVEMLRFFKQRNIKVAVLSTHSTKRAVQYLQLTDLYNKVDFVLGNDGHEPFPSKNTLLNICEKMNTSIEDTLLVANFPSLVHAANEAFMKITYLHDIGEYREIKSIAPYEVVKNNLGVINVILFSKYDNIDMYSTILGMNETMNSRQLMNVYMRLQNEYATDEQLLMLIDRVYHYYHALLPQEPRVIFEEEVETNVEEVIEETEEEPTESLILESIEQPEIEMVEEVESTVEVLLEQPEVEIVNEVESTVEVSLEQPEIEIAKEVEMPVEAVLAQAVVEMPTETILEVATENIEGSIDNVVEPIESTLVNEEVDDIVFEPIKEVSDTDEWRRPFRSKNTVVAQEEGITLNQEALKDGVPESENSLNDDELFIIEGELNGDKVLGDQFKTDAIYVNSLMDQINNVEAKLVEIDKKPLEIKEVKESKEDAKKVNKILLALYSLMGAVFASVFIVGGSLLAYMFFNDLLYSDFIVAEIIYSGILGIVTIISGLLEMIVGVACIILPGTATVSTVLAGNAYLSAMAIQVFWFIFFFTVLILTIKAIVRSLLND